MSLFGMGNASIHLVNKSATTNMYEFLFSLSENGPLMSMAIICAGWLGAMFPSGALLGVGEDFLVVQLAQDWHHLRVSFQYPSQ